MNFEIMMLSMCLLLLRPPGAASVGGDAAREVETLSGTRSMSALQRNHFNDAYFTDTINKEEYDGSSIASSNVRAKRDADNSFLKVDEDPLNIDRSRFSLDDTEIFHLFGYDRSYPAYPMFEDELVDMTTDYEGNHAKTGDSVSLLLRSIIRAERKTNSILNADVF